MDLKAFERCLSKSPRVPPPHKSPESAEVEVVRDSDATTTLFGKFKVNDEDLARVATLMQQRDPFEHQGELTEKRRKIIGARLRKTRLKLGMTQGEIATLLGIPVSRWSAVEAGEYFSEFGGWDGRSRRT